MYLKRCLSNFKNNKSDKFKHSMKSFQQGIRFNSCNNITINIIFLIYICNDIVNINGEISKYTTLDIQEFYWIWYLFINIVLCISISYTLYTVTEIKHLSENENDNVVKNFLKKYVLYGIVSLIFQLIVISKIKIPSIYLRVSLIFIIVIFMLGMADILNNYNKSKFQEVKALLDYLKISTHRKKCNKVFIYNIKNICKGFYLLIFNK
ncbi:hypothetical protein ADU88_04060 [Clostridium botulinum]|nr:hypothetical protein ADU88_04060 [Clostridium botulinum]